ncbi:MAG: hypothetical protein KC561_19135, partial [Myxococcales bacterium]|nr:hypothetical protein [Myxococcales bacterium]
MRRTTAFTLLVCSIFAGHVAWADDVPRVIPYSGYLEIDGEPYNGDAQFRFRLYDAGGTLEWGETYSGDDTVPVVDGHFDVYLGAVTGGLAGDFLRAEYLTLRIYYKEEGHSGYTRVYPDQVIVPVPYALWTTASGPLTVNGTLDLGSQATFSGDIDVDGNVALNSNGSIVAQGTVSGTSLEAYGIFDADGVDATVDVTGQLTVTDQFLVDGGDLLLRDSIPVLSTEDSGDAFGIG